MRSYISLENDKLKLHVRRMSRHPAVDWKHLTPTAAMDEMATIRDLLVAAEMVQRLNAAPDIDRRTQNAGYVHADAALAVATRLIKGMPHTDIYAVLAEDIHARIRRVSGDATYIR